MLTRVSCAEVSVDGETVASISAASTGGILALVGVARGDGPADVATMVRKIAELRMLDGELSATDADAPVLVVSQFTLQGQTTKGRRPSWSSAAPGDAAEPLITEVVAGLRQRGLKVSEGVFGANMRVSSVNEGPFTLLVET